MFWKDSQSKLLKKEKGYCDGSFYVSTWPGYRVQFGQTLTYMLLWRFFVDVINLYNQLTLNKRDCTW